MANVAIRNPFHNGLEEKEKDMGGVIPADMLNALNVTFGQNESENNKLRDILIHIVYALDLLNSKTNANKELLAKLDLLTATLQNSNAELQQTPSSSFEQDFGNVITRKGDLQWQFMRSEHLSVYYDELVHREKPYVPYKFRSKVTRNMPAYEQKLKQEKSINNVKVEIRLMKETMATCKMELERLNREIKTYLESPRLPKPLKVEYTTKMSQNEEKCRKNWRANFSRIKSRCQKDLASGADQYLLRYSEEEKNLTFSQDNLDQRNDIHWDKHRANGH